MRNMEQNLKNRTKCFALKIIQLVDTLPKTSAAFVLGKQLVRSATSVGANYRSACRGRSKAEFISKLGIVVEEADETCFWLELIIESRLLPQDKAHPLLLEASELTAIFVASIKTSQKNQKSHLKNQKL